MALEVRGHVVLTHGEYIELMKGLRSAEGGSWALHALSHGAENVTPMDVYSALEIDCRIAAGGDGRLHGIIDRASSRLSAAFPY